MKTTATEKAWAAEAIETARAHLGEGTMVSSAQLAACDAESCMGKGDYLYAMARAADSLAYSVGIFHPDARKVTVRFNQAAGRVRP